MKKTHLHWLTTKVINTRAISSKLIAFRHISFRAMTRLVIFASLASMPTAFAGKIQYNLAAGTQPSSVSHNYNVYTPPSYDGSTPLPMVFALHGCNQTEDTIFSEFGWQDSADAHNFILVAPHSNAAATPTIENAECWNYWVSDHQDRGEGMNVDLVRIGEQVESDYNIDPSRRYITGLSSGGFMTTIAVATYNDYWTAGVAMAAGGYKETSNSANGNAWCYLNFASYQSASAIAGDLAAARSASPSDFDTPIMFMNSNYDCTVNIQGGITGSEGFALFHNASIDNSLTKDCSVTDSAGTIACENKKYTNASGNILIETYFYDGPSDDNPNGNFHATHNSKGHYFSGAKTSGNYSETWGQNAREAAWTFFAQFDRNGEIPTNPASCDAITHSLNDHVAAGRAYTSGTTNYCDVHTSSTYTHVLNGRAAICYYWYACARDDGALLGLFNIYTPATLYESPASVYTTTQCSTASAIEYFATGTGELLGTNGNVNVALYEISTGVFSKTDPLNCDE
jgi:poly(hydroxyalkanoate) depolymerase family esterase